VPGDKGEVEDTLQGFDLVVSCLSCGPTLAAISAEVADARTRRRSVCLAGDQPGRSA